MGDTTFARYGGVSLTILFISLSHSADTSCRGREIQRGGVCRWSRSRCDSAGEVDEDGRKESLGKFHG